MVSLSVFLAISVSFFAMLIPVPLLFIFLWRKRQFPVNSFFSGAAVFILFYLVIRYYAMNAFNFPGGRGSMISLLVSALVVEGGRFAGFLLLPKKEGAPEKSMKSALSLSLGYLTAAFLLISAFQMAMNFVYAGALEGWGFLSDYLNRFPRESIDLVQLLILETPPVSYLLETLSLYLAVPVQICLTLLIFEGFRRGKNSARTVPGVGAERKSRPYSRWFFFAGAVLGDYLYYQLSVLASGSGWAAHTLYLTIFGGAALYLTGRLWKEEIFDCFRSP